MYREVISSCEKLNIDRTFQCGQCFRWLRQEDGSYRGVVDNALVAVWNENGKVLLEASEERDWQDYFDLKRDYRLADESLRGFSDYLDQCIDAGQGMHILKQDPWETLISFIISQCNNIPRIQGIIQRMCSQLGTPIFADGHKDYRFPTPLQILNACDDDWDYIKAGYRTRYIVETSRYILDGFDLNRLKELPWEKSRDELKKLPGVGEKVANCINLFGLNHIESFPVDTWIRKALAAHFPEDFDPVILGSFAGLAQQYIFDYERTQEMSEI